MRAIIAVLVGCLLLTVGITTLLLYPFSPYVPYGEPSLIPLSACPESEVMVRADLEIESGWDLSRLETESIWRPLGKNEGEGAESGGSGVILNPEPRGRSEMVSSIIRDAPGEPGTYRLYTEATVYGTFGEGNVFRGFPKVQRQDYTSRGILTVLPEYHKECEGGG